MKVLLAACLVLLTASSYASAPYTPAPDTPLLLCDYGNPEVVSRWVGEIPHSVTTDKTTDGTSAMRISIPKYEPGKEERPGVVLKYDEGRGFPFRDFSRYGKLVVDVWVDGVVPGKMGLKVRDIHGTNSWTAHITVEPGKVNHAELLMSDAVADADMTQVDEVVLYALRPDHAYTLVVDNLRLLPPDHPPAPASFDLRYPNYRNMLFPGNNRIEVLADLALDANKLATSDVEIVVDADNTHESTQKVFRPTESTGQTHFSVSVRGFDAGPIQLTAWLENRKTGETLAYRKWRLEKLTVTEAARQQVYVDRDNNVVCDGQPFFPLGWYGSANEQQMNEVADGPFNCMILYGGADAAFMDKMQARGLKLLNCMMYSPGFWESKAATDAMDRIRETRRHPALLGWYLNDEIPRTRVAELEDHLSRVHSADPYHPTLCVLCNRCDFPHLQHTADIFGWDHYPVPTERLGTVSAFMDAGNRAVHGAKPVWAVLQAFGWYQYRPENGNRGRVPTQEELDKGRAPTFDEVRCMTYLALARGAKGIFYYCYYDLRVLPQYAEMWPWLKRIGAEVKALSPVLLSPDDRGTASVSPANSAITTRVIGHGGRVYLIAVNDSKDAVAATLQVTGGTRAKVLFEDREVVNDKHGFAESFKPYEAHVYEID